MKRYELLPAAAALVALVVSASACDQGLSGLNENPNAPTDVGAEYLLPQALQSTVEYANYNTWFTLEFTGIFAQHWAKIQYTDEDRYELRPNVIDGFWNNFYSGPLKDWQLIIEKGQATGLANHEAIGRIAKVYTFHLITDIWGDIPHSEALRADDPQSPITAPAYDSQASIYTAMLAELATAVGLLDAGARSFGAEDLIYGGDVAKWERFANSLRLRLAMRISDVSPAVARPIVEALASQPLITSNADNFTLVYLTASPNQNPLHENAATALGGSGSRDDHAVSNSLVNLLGALNDPRIEVYAEPAQLDSLTADFAWCGGAGEPPCHVLYNGQVFRGMRNGVLSENVPTPFSYWSRLGSHFRARPETPQPLLTAAEVNFLLAEAAEKGWSVGGTAQAYYEAGVRAAFALWDGADGVDLGTAVQDAYLLQPGVAYGSTPVDGAGNNFELIAEQKWLALYTISPEAYAEYRRTGYPDELLPSMNATIISTIPGRIPYADIEQSLNAANLAAAISAQSSMGVDGTYDGRVWWDPTPP